MNQELLKKAVAEAALAYVTPDEFLGVGTGSTANHFIDALALHGPKIRGAVASSKATEQRLKQHGIEVFALNDVDALDCYVDGADEFNPNLQLIKGGGGALTREKIVAAVAKRFVCIVDASKEVATLGAFPLPVEVIPMARSYVAREIVKLGGTPVYRENFVTANGNQILDIWGWSITRPEYLEQAINNITGVVCNGLFALRPADIVLVSKPSGVKTLKIET